VRDRREPRSRQEGQVLVIVAVGFLAFLGFAALVIDVGMAYSVERAEHATADSAALAGAQQLFVAGTRTTDYTGACNKAVDNVFRALSGASAPANACSSGSLVRYPVAGTPYVVSVNAPAPAALCVNCDPSSSVLVSIVRPQLPTTFSHLFGQAAWNPGRASIAGAGFAPSFAVQVLQYPGVPTECQDIMLNGSGTIVHVVNGDVGTNTGVKNGGASGQGVYQLDPGFRVWQYDTQVVCPPPFPYPAGQLSGHITDPNYTYPTRSGAPGSGPDTAANCASFQATVPAQYKVGGTSIKNMAAAKVTCYKPGIYPGLLSGNHNSEAWLLEPGVYFFDGGLRAGLGALVGGWEAGSRGVSLVFPETKAALMSNNIGLFALNGGSKFLNPAGQEATAAVGYDGATIQTTGFNPELPITLFVSKGPTTNALNVGGGGSLYVGGVQYAPTDQVSIVGNSSGGTNQVGLIIAWTITYSGNTTITEVGPPNTNKLGKVRLDAACSGAQQGNPLCFP
jgi:Flp pilus assembly protein TadG